MRSQKFSLKIAIILALAALPALFFLLMPKTTRAQTIEELLAQIATVQSQIAELQRQLQNVQSGMPSAVTPPVAAGLFAVDLKLGDRGPSVRALQEALNKNPVTQVALSGAGSPGQETDFFGELTKQAVIRFQNLYKDDVLSPAGLVQGTGFVGARTRQKLTYISGVGQTIPSPAVITPTPSPTPISPAAPVAAPLKTGNFRIKILEKSYGDTRVEGEPGALVAVIDGDEAFNKLPFVVNDEAALLALFNRPDAFDAGGNTVNFGETKITGLVSDGKALFFNVPDDAVPGVYSVSVTNSKGTSDETHFTVTKPVSASNAPKIKSISPTSGPNGTIVTITGSNFSATENMVTSGFEVYTKIPSSKNGTEISITLRSAFPDETRKYLVPLTYIFFVETNGKLSNGHSFILTQ